MRLRTMLVLCAALALTVGVATAVGGGAPSIAFNPSSYNYGTIDSGTTASNSFTLTNSGGSASGGLTVSFTGSSAFSKTADTCTAASLGPKKSCSVTVRYAPTTDGSSDTGTLTAQSKKSVVVAAAPLLGASTRSCTSVTCLAAAANAGDTNIKVTSINALGTTLAAASNAGDTNIKVTTTAPFIGTNLAAASNAGDSNIKVISTAVLKVGQTIHVDTGVGEEDATIQAVGTSGAAGTGISLTAPLASAHAGGVSVTPAGQTIHVDTGAGEEDATIQAVGTSGAAGTGITLTAALASAHVSGSQVDVASISIDDGANQETVSITNVGTSGTAGTGVDLSPALSKAHPSGAAVIAHYP